MNLNIQRPILTLARLFPGITGHKLAGGEATMPPCAVFGTHGNIDDVEMRNGQSVPASQSTVPIKLGAWEEGSAVRHEPLGQDQNASNDSWLLRYPVQIM